MLQDTLLIRRMNTFITDVCDLSQLALASAERGKKQNGTEKEKACPKNMSMPGGP